MLGELRRLAGPTVEVLGAQPFDVLKKAYSECRALIFPGEEDFGMVPVEAMASGRPVIAFAQGGATETVVDQLTGLFFNEQQIDSIVSAVASSEKMTFDPIAIAEHARQFDKRRFTERMSAHIEELLNSR
jgi:glycosyltransferase involved in cell wall biosynthesis